MLSTPLMCASPLAPGLFALQFSAVPGLHHGATPQHLRKNDFNNTDHHTLIREHTPWFS